ncbi:MAG: DUF6141 family protein [Caldilineaceae bacterium]|jgi:hypothetical protein
MNEIPPVRFREEQRFRGPWLWLIIAFVAGLQWWGFYRQIVLGKPWGNNPAPDWMMVLLWLAFGIGLPLLFFLFELVVTVNASAVEIRFSPVVRRTIPLTEIAKVEARTYAPLKEYGGWGIRVGLSGKRAYNISGNEGVELTLTDGRKVLIGSKRSKELAQIIASAM